MTSITKANAISNKVVWVLQALQPLLNRSISFSEALGFAGTRFGGYSKEFTLRGITFPNVDRELWQQAFHLFFRSEYTPSRFAIGSEDIVVDVGANRGVFVALAASSTSGPIIAFEPDTANFANLARLVEFNGLNQVKLHKSAVTGRTGHIRLYKARKDTRHTIIGKDVLSKQDLSEFEVVSAICLDDALQDLSRIDLLKMDCEGAEFEIVSHASDRTLKKIRRLVMEYHSERGSIDVDILVKRLENVGFNVKIRDMLRLPLGLLFAVNPQNG